MFKRANRLGSAVLKTNFPGKIVSGPFLIRFGKNNTGHNRFAVVVGVKFEKKASGRNRWKRSMREKLKKWPNLSVDAVVSPTKQAKGTDPGKITEILLSAYEKIKTK